MFVFGKQFAILSDSIPQSTVYFSLASAVNLFGLCLTFWAVCSHAPPVFLHPRALIK